MNISPSQRRLLRRLKIVEGQVRGLQRMIEQGTYCIDVITQASAVRNALSTVEDALLEGHLGSCVARQMKAGQIATVQREVLKVYRLKRG